MPVKALIVDDSAATRQVIKYHLLKMGCVVAGEATSAADGLKLFRELKPDIVTLDLMMPEHEAVDSMAALRAMRTDAPGLVVIVASAVPFQKTIDSFLKEGILHYVVKPFTQFSFDPVARKLEKIFPELGSVVPFHR
jgi:two-component system chemotaxis response regulator CheY